MERTMKVITVEDVGVGEDFSIQDAEQSLFSPLLLPAGCQAQPSFPAQPL